MTNFALTRTHARAHTHTHAHARLYTHMNTCQCIHVHIRIQVMSLIRLAPIPLGVKNYGLSLVRFPGDRFFFLRIFLSFFF